MILLKKMFFLISIFLLSFCLFADINIQISNQTKQPFILYPFEQSEFYLKIENKSSSYAHVFISISSQKEFSFQNEPIFFKEEVFPPSAVRQIKIPIKSETQNLGEKNLLITYFTKKDKTKRAIVFPIQIKESPLQIDFNYTKKEPEYIFNFILKAKENITNITIEPQPSSSLIFLSKPIFIENLPKDKNLVLPPFSFHELKKSSSPRFILFKITFSDSQGNHTIFLKEDLFTISKKQYLLYLCILAVLLAVLSLFVNKKRKSKPKENSNPK